MRYTDDGKFLIAGNMDSIKIWEIEQARISDIIMKPQSLIYDMNFNKDFLFGTLFKWFMYILVAEFNNSSSSVTLS
jgi:hypothetical protein